MRTRRSIRAATAVALTLLMLLSLAQPATAAIHTWTPPPIPYPGNWHCTFEDFPKDSTPRRGAVHVCLIHGNNGTEPTFRAVMIVWNVGNGFQMTGAKINLWATPSPSTLVQEDACYDSGLSGGHESACYGTPVTRSHVCADKPNATRIHAVGAITIPALSSSRITVSSESRALVC